MRNIYALALLTTGNEVLLARRHNVSFGENMYSMIGGKVEQGETARHAIHREVLEEMQLNIPEAAFTLVHTLHRKGTETEFVALCFAADISKLPVPYNNEPDKHSDMRFFPFEQLPDNMLPAHKQIVDCFLRNINYSEHGW